jgi:hypothetical protein
MKKALDIRTIVEQMGIDQERFEKQVLSQFRQFDTSVYQPKINPDLIRHPDLLLAMNN